MSMLIRYLKQRRMVILAFCSFFLILFFSFYLYHLPLAAVLYPVLLCALAAAGYAARDIRRVLRRHAELQRLSALPGELMDVLPPAESIEAADYQQLLQSLREEQKRILSTANARQADLIEYYMTWAHQIKTPIAAMRLHLQNEDSPCSRTLLLELMRIEQYVEMLLAYLRLGSDSTDYVFREYDLDGIIRQAVRRFSGEFIARHLSLDYEPLRLKVVTDEKWLAFVIEQVLSNALKYTRKGGVSIFLREPSVLCIRDTGIGIAAEDLPRIFENGYTGLNGRSSKEASGLGLHLCRRICRNLGHGIDAESIPGKGTTLCIDLAQKRVEAE